MSKNDSQEQQLKQMIQDHLLNQEEHGKDNSFVFLESKSLHLIINYLLMQLDTSQLNSGGKIEAFDLDEILSYIDSLIQEDKKQFEEIIRILNEKK